MTLVCRQVASRHPARSLEEQIVLAVEPATNRVLHHLKMKTKGKVKFPLEIFENRSEVDIRCDLLDCAISICSPQVPPLFSDNFDYLTRDDFIRGILEHEEILGNSIHCYLLTSGYTARISNLHMYDVVTRDVIARWVYPLCPDMGFPDGDVYVNQTALYKRHHIYHQRNVQLAMGSILEQNVIVGQDSSVGENTVVRNSVIGKKCTVGANCMIDGAYIWDGCKIGDSCKIGKCVIAAECEIGDGSHVRDGCVFGYNVKIGPNADIPASTRLIGEQDFNLMKSKNEDAESERASYDFQPADEQMLGHAGPVWTFSLSTRREDEDESDVESTDYEEISWNWTAETGIHHEDLDQDTSSETSDADSVDGTVEDRVRSFFLEVSDSLIRGLREEVSAENMILEINSSKFANNVTMEQLNMLVVRSIMEIPEIRAKEKRKEFKNAAEVATELKSIFKVLRPVLKRYLKSDESQKDAIYSLEDCAVNYAELPKHQPYGTYVADIFVNIIHFWYNEEIVTEDVIKEWYAEGSRYHAMRFLPFVLHEGQSASSRRRHQSGDMSDDEINAVALKIDALRVKVQPLITWFDEAEEESGDSE